MTTLGFGKGILCSVRENKRKEFEYDARRPAVNTLWINQVLWQYQKWKDVEASGQMQSKFVIEELDISVIWKGKPEQDFSLHWV